MRQIIGGIVIGILLFLVFLLVVFLIAPNGPSVKDESAFEANPIGLYL